MGALTIKSYYYESRPWELSKVCIPNILTSYPNYILLCFKNEYLFKILPWNRNELISNELRFSLDFFSNIFDFNKKSFKKKFFSNFMPCIIILQYLTSLCGIKSNSKNYTFKLYSNFFVIHNYLNKNFFNLQLKKAKSLQYSNLKYFEISHFGFLKNINDCLNDYFVHICIDTNSLIKFTDLYYYINNNNNNSLFNNEIIEEQLLLNDYNKFSILNFLINSFNITFYYKLILKRIFKKFIMDFSFFCITFKNMLSKYFPYDISHHNNNIYHYYISCIFLDFNYINSIGFLIGDLKELQLQKKK